MNCSPSVVVGMPLCGVVRGSVVAASVVEEPTFAVILEFLESGFSFKISHTKRNFLHWHEPSYSL